MKNRVHVEAKLRASRLDVIDRHSECMERIKSRLTKLYLNRLSQTRRSLILQSNQIIKEELDKMDYSIVNDIKSHLKVMRKEGLI